MGKVQKLKMANTCPVLAANIPAVEAADNSSTQPDDTASRRMRDGLTRAELQQTENWLLINGKVASSLRRATVFEYYVPPGVRLRKVHRGASRQPPAVALSPALSITLSGPQQHQSLCIHGLQGASLVPHQLFNPLARVGGEDTLTNSSTK